MIPKDRFSSSENYAWKGYDFDIINELEEEGFINQGSNRNQIHIYDKGLEKEKKILEKYNN